MKFLLLLLPLQLSAQTRIVFTPQWTAQSQFAGYYVALEKGFYKSAGLDVEIEFRPWSLWSFMTPAKERQTVGITLLAKYLGGDVKLSSEHTEYKWIYPAEFADMSADPSLKAEIAKYAEQK